MEKCFYCGAEIDEDDKFCNMCGEQVIRIMSRCPSCNSLISSKSTYCANCGKKINNKKSSYFLIYRSYNEFRFYLMLGFVICIDFIWLLLYFTL